MKTNVFLYRIRKYVLFTAALVCAGISLSLAVKSAQQPERLYTQAQAERGKLLYAQHCAVCHGQSLEGTPSSPLAGERFMAKWNDRTLDELYSLTKMQMPYGKPDSLTPQQYLDIVAFMLASNGYAAGTRELSADATLLKQTRLTRQSGAPVAPTAAPVFFSSGTKASTAKPTQAELNAARANTSDWLVSNHDYGGQRFVDLKQINRRNAATLQPVAIYQVADANVFHNNPLVYQGVMYVATSNATMALDAATLKVKWRVDRKPKGPDGWLMHRGVALKDGKVVRGTHDGYLLAYDAVDGKLLWERPVLDRKKREAGFTMAPVLFEDLILIGTAGSEGGVKGWVGAFRLEDGERVWRFNTVPDEGEPGAETWKDAKARETGGGSTWAPFSLDAEKGVLYVPVSNPAPDLFTDSRLGNNLYTNSLLALDARDGKVLYRFNAGSPINGGIITYAINGRQYVAVNSGNATGFWQAAKGSATVLLFALPESKP